MKPSATISEYPSSDAVPPRRTRRHGDLVAAFLSAGLLSYWSMLSVSAQEESEPTPPRPSTSLAEFPPQSDAPLLKPGDLPGAGVPTQPEKPVQPPPPSPTPDVQNNPDDTHGTAITDPGPEPQGNDDEDEAGEVIELYDRYVPGSAQTIGAAELQRFERDNIHQVLSAVPGVYIREEDGYGLRPNIGMRGSGSERSAKIALMEDGVLIAPAPYSAPAAYYFPLITRMERVDVLKGPAAIEYGPNTIGGAINMRSRPVPWEQEGELDAALGGYTYSKLHASYGHSVERAGFLIEGLNLHSNGFKNLDTGEDTGFAKKDGQIKLRFNSDSSAGSYHQLDIKLGYSDELSNETYIGLTEDDFAATPYRRYAATQLDLMDWRHLRAQIDYRLELPSGTRIVTTAYRHDFSRSWRKLNRFNSDRSINDILAEPDSGNNAVFYAILQGQADSTSEAEMLMLGDNQRDYVSQGVQTTGRIRRDMLGGRNTIDIGARLHYDSINRYHTEDGYFMLDGALGSAEVDTIVNRDETHSALALATFIRDKWQRGRFTVTAGTRAELIHNQWTNRHMADADGTANFFVLIPGAGAVYRPTEELELIAGVHKGFVPVAPAQAPDVKPETSINYEAGMRYSAPRQAFELIGFFSDYSNIKGTCTFSSGCSDEQIGNEFNGGSVHVMGVEAAGTWQVPVTSSLSAPVRFSYTFNRSRFQESFTSTNPLWGDVQRGDALPYLPNHQVALRAGLAHRRGHLFTSMSYVSGMRDVASQGMPIDGQYTDGYVVLDVAAAWQVGRLGKLYLTVDNILDQAYMVSRRPIGTRPGKPRLFVLGYKNNF